MKVLVIGLLRIGDFLQTLPVLHGLRVQSSVRQLDVLTFAPTEMLKPMVSGVSKWWTLDRDELQRGLGEAEIPMLTSFSVLQEKLNAIDAQKYDAIINLSQTRFSAWIAGYLHTANRTGLALDARGKPHFHSPWFQYLDDHATQEAKDIFHYTDIFFYGSGLKGSERQWWLKETARGKDEADRLAIGEGSERIALQLLTSDAKKNWSEDSWLAMLKQLRLFRPHAEFIALAAPNEEDKINTFLARAETSKLRVQKAIVSLEGALSILKRSQLLITGDTSIKHLALAADIPILELSLGSSDYRRTGAYRPDSLILQPAVECAPCPHSSPCTKAAHDCALALSPEAVSASAHHLLSGDWLGLKNLASAYAPELRLLRTHHLDSGFWFASDLAQLEPERVVDTILERCTWKFVLNREHLNPVAQFGSEGIYMRRELEVLLPETALATVDSHLGFLEKQASIHVEKVSHMWENSRPRPSVQNGVVEIGGVRRMQAQLERVFHQSNVKLKLIRSLKSQLMEEK